jgi:uncharacterized Zn finger protein (UPF0148 family)
MDEQLTEENCPQCGKELNPPLKSGRQVCSNCGCWANKSKQAIEVMPEKTDDGNSTLEKDEDRNHQEVTPEKDSKLTFLKSTATSKSFIQRSLNGTYTPRDQVVGALIGIAFGVPLGLYLSGAEKSSNPQPVVMSSF